MLKSITLIEWLIIVVIIGILAALYAAPNGAKDRLERCLSNGYTLVEHTSYCTKVQGGNTIVIHVDSLR
jgi:hypothetical protein